MIHLDISDLSPLEKELEDFRPHLAIADSLTSITRDSGLSEKDAEFTKPIYKFKELLSRYGAAGILIHHLNFEFVGEFGDESGEKRTQGKRVVELLRKFSPRGLEYQEIEAPKEPLRERYLNVGKSLYTVLDRLEDRQLITKRRSLFVPEAISLTDARRWVYCLPHHTTGEDL